MRYADRHSADFLTASKAGYRSVQNWLWYLFATYSASQLDDFAFNRAGVSLYSRECIAACDCLAYGRRAALRFIQETDYAA